MGLEISIVIPAFNEERRLPATLEALLRDLPAVCPANWEVVVSDDGSTDDTVEVVKDLADTDAVRIVSTSHNTGKGAALLRGVRASSHEIVVLLDADLPVPVQTIAVMLGHAQQADLVLGSRRLPGASFDPPQPILRRLGGHLFRGAVAVLGYSGPSDPQCGVKLLRRDRMSEVLASMECKGFAFDVELIERSRRRGISMVEVPVTWSHVEGSSLHPLRDALATLRELARLRARLRGSQALRAGSLP